MAKRYKAGTIFLDVVPSFRGVQQAIKKEVEKYNADAVKNAEELGEKTGREQAEAHAKAAARVEKDSAEKRLSTKKGVNEALVRNEVQTARQITQAHLDGIQKWTDAERAAYDKLSDDRKAQLAKAAAVDDAWLKGREKAEAASRRRRDAETRKSRETLWKWTADGIKEISKAWDDAHDEEIARTKERMKYEEDFNNLLIEDEEDLAAAMAKGREHLSKLREKSNEEESRYHREAMARTAAEEKAELERIAATTIAERKAAEDKAKADEKARADELAAEQQLAREILAIQRRADLEAKELDRERADELSRSGGRIGKLIHKGLTGALEDLPEVKVDADTDGAVRSLADLRARMVALREQKIGVDISFGDAMTEFAKIQAGLRAVSRGADGSVRINTLAAMSAMKAVDERLDRLKRETRKPTIMRIIVSYITTGRRPSNNVHRGDGALGAFGATGQDGANAFRVFNPLVLIAVGLLSTLGPAAAVAGAGIMGLVGTLTAATAGLAVLILAFGGLFTAIQDQIKLEDDMGQASEAAAKQRATAARQVRDAKERLGDAEVNAARATEDAARRVADAEQGLADARRQAADDIAAAERSVADAQRSAEDAQRSLNEARREAKRDLQDLALAYAGSQLDEKEAKNAIRLAQERLNEVRRRAFMGDATGAEVRAAEIDVAQARHRATESTVRRRRAGQDNTRAQRSGVEGSDRVQDALRAQQDAQRNLADATKNVSRVREASARRIADAERGVTDALRAQSRVAQDNARMLRDARQSLADAQSSMAEAGTQMSTAARNAKKSMDELHPSAQRFALFILSLRDDMARLRGLAAAGLFPGLEAGMRELSIYEDGMARFATDMGVMWGDTFRSIGQQMTGSTWQSFFHTMGQDGPKQAGLFNQALFNIITTVAALVDAFSPFTTNFLEGFVNMTGDLANWAANLKGSPGFERFLQYVYDTAPVVGNFLWEMGRAFGNIAIALSPLGEGIMKVLTKLFEEISAMDPELLQQIATGFVAVFLAMQLSAGASSLLMSLLNPFTSGLSSLVFILAIAAVALIYFYQTNEDVRKVVDKVIGKLKEFGAWLWDNRGTVLKLTAAIGTLFVIFKVVSAMMALRQALIALGIMGHVSRLAVLLFKGLVLLSKGLLLAMKGVFRLSMALLANPIGIVIVAIGLLVGSIIYLWKTNETFRKKVKAVWAAIKDIFWAGVKFAREELDRLKEGANKLIDGFKKVVQGIKRVWNGLGDVIANPIDSALQYIQLNFINGINKLLDKAGLKLRIPTIWEPGAVRKSRNRGNQTGSYKAAGIGYARGGILPGYTPMAKGDDQLRPMRSGEGVLVSEGLRDTRSKSMFLAANEAAKRGVSFADYFGQGYARGGIVDLGKRLQQMGYHVSEHPAFGGVVPGAHSPNGYHYTGGALDINADSWNSKFGNEMAALDRLNAMLRSEGWNTIWRAAGHFDHLHVDIAKGQRGGGGGFMDKVWGFLFDKAEGIIDKIPGDNIFAKSGKGFLKKSLSGWEKMILGEAGTLDMGEGSVGGGSGGVQRWRGVVSRALGIMGQSPLLLNTTLRRMQQESGGNPRAINMWDSNAARGTPSKGLMQVIDPTFRAYAHPRYDNNIYDPLSNILASMRYALRRYGSLSAAYNRRGGYATGTDSATAGWHMVGEEGPELVNFGGGEQVYNRKQTLRMQQLSAQRRELAPAVYVKDPWTAQYHEAKMVELIDESNDFTTSIGRMGPRG